MKTMIDHSLLVLATVLLCGTSEYSSAIDPEKQPTAAQQGGQPHARVLDTRVISTHSTHYHGWPTLIQRRNGELLVAYSGGREHHVCPFGRVEIIQSRDQGQTWSFPRVVLDGAIDDRDAGLCETAQGSLLVSTFTSLAYEATLAKLQGQELERWLAVHHRLNADQRQRELGVWMLRSTDGGVTWSSRYACTVDSPHGPVQLQDGRLLYAGVGLWEAERRVGVVESQDDGVTWKWLSDIPAGQAHDRQHYHELHLVECRSGRLLVHIRNHNPTDELETLQTESEDGGKTWSVPHSIGVWGLPSHLLQLSDGRILMTYGYRRQPFGNQARISSDAGASWSAPLTISADGTSGDLGYPSTVELPGGDLYTVWYEKLADNPAAVLRAARWQLVAP